MFSFIKHLGFRLLAIVGLIVALILFVANVLDSLCCALADAWHEFHDSWDSYHEQSKETFSGLIKTIWRALLRGEKL